jgi:hypothetical protein
MITASLMSYRVVGVTGVAKKWSITSPSDVQEIGDRAFVKLNTQNTSLWALIASNNPKVLGGANSQSRDLKTSKGLTELIAMRNRIQSAALAPEQPQICSLFEAPKKKAKVTFARDKATAKRTAPESLIIPLQMDGTTYEVSVLRPVHPQDAVFVEYNNASIAAVVQWLRTSEFDEGLKRARTLGLPKGIHKRLFGEKKYAVVYTKPDGSISQKLVRELDDALAFHADPTIKFDDSSDDDDAESAQEDGSDKND